MNAGLLPRVFHHGLLDAITPSMRYDGKKELSAWQREARAKLEELLGFNEIRKNAIKPEIEIEYDKYAEDLDCREIRFRVTTEENVTVPCHLCIPKDAKGALPVAITMQGHSRGMHISLARPKYPTDPETINGGDRDFVRRALREGVCGISVEQRCFGENGSKEGTAGVPDCTEVAMRALLLGRTLVGERVWDILRLIDALSTDARFAEIIDINKLICLGNSGGGTATIYASALDERIKISVPSCSVCRYADSIGARYHCECNFVPSIAKYFDMGDLCAMVAPRDLVVINGVLDTDFPIDGAKACVEVGREAYKAVGRENAIVHVIGDGGHRFYADDSWPHIHKALGNL